MFFHLFGHFLICFCYRLFELIIILIYDAGDCNNNGAHESNAIEDGAADEEYP